MNEKVEIIFGLLGGDCCHIFDYFIREDFQSIMGYNIFYPVLGGWFFVAASISFPVGAGVVIVSFPALSSAALSDHRRAAMSAENFTRQ